MHELYSLIWKQFQHTCHFFAHFFCFGCIGFKLCRVHIFQVFCLLNGIDLIILEFFMSLRAIIQQNGRTFL